MYIHIGGEYSIPYKVIVGIFDFDELVTEGCTGLEFLTRAEKENRVENVSYDIPRSVIVTLERVYISPISTRTIRKRIGHLEHDID